MRYGKGENVIPETPFEMGVMRDSKMFLEYGAPFDLRQLPAPEYDAHLAIIEGIQLKRKEESDKAERDSNNRTNQYR